MNYNFDFKEIVNKMKGGGAPEDFIKKYNVFEDKEGL